MDLRCFIAIEIPADVREAISEAISPIKGLAQESIKWVRPENIHITLKFLGSTQEKMLDSIEAALTRSASVIPSFEAEIKGTGAFPDLKRPSVLWVGLEHPPALLELKELMEVEFATLGFDRDERAFSPHLTVGRIRRGTRLPRMRLTAAFDQIREKSFGNMSISDIQLMKSDLRPGGPVYTRLFSAGLSGP